LPFARQSPRLEDRFYKIDMNKLLIGMFCFGLAAPVFADGTNQLADPIARGSYAYGWLNGNGWKKQDADIDPELFIKGLKDGLAGTSMMTEAEANQAWQEYLKGLRMRQAGKNKAQSEAFLATNKLAAGIKLLSVPLPNGQTDDVQYLVLTSGIGPVPKSNDRVKVNYRGTLLNGIEFDSSYKRGQPATFPVTGVIKGWTEALEHMPVGSKWKLFIPADLAYGETGSRSIPPNSTLIFEVELLDIEAPAPPPVPHAAPAPAAPAAPLTSDIIKVPSKAELDKGAKIEVIKAEDVQKMQAQQTNASPQNNK
jgi:FKBP-type peptidyl-prolyl cis-trans isomerase